MWVLENCHVLDIDSGLFSGPTNVVVEGTDVVAIGSDDIGDLARVDLNGAYVVPGLIDCHVHLVAHTADLSGLRLSAPSYLGIVAAARARMSVQQGFTRLRDVGGADAGIASACAQQFFPAPHVHFGGPALSQTGGHGDMRNRGESNGGTLSNGISIVVDGEFAVRQATREAMRQGAGHVKLMLSGGVASPSDPLDGQQYSEAEIRAAVEESDAFGRYVAGHCYTSTSITRALLLGVRSIEHGNYADDATLDLITSRGAYLVPTLATYHMLAKEGAAHGLPPVSQAKVGDLLDAGLDTLQRAVMRGTPICFGTDLLGEMHGHQVGEFTLRAKVQPIIDVLRSATVTAATLLGVADRAGRVRPGMLADMAIYSVDPLSSPDVLARPDRFLRMVVVAGRAVLDRTHGRSP